MTEAIEVDNHIEYYNNTVFTLKAQNLRFAKRGYSSLDLKSDMRVHHDQLERSIEKYGQSRGHMSPLTERYAIYRISRTRAGDLCYVNPFARLAWQDLILGAIEECELDQSTLYMTTIMDSDWNFSDKDWALDVDAIKKTVRNRFRGLNYLFMLELAWFRNVKWRNGRLIAPHVQGISWGQISKREMAKITKRFNGGQFGSHAIRRCKIYNLPGAISYSIKPPYHGYSVFQRRDGRFGHRRSDLWLTQHFELYRRLKDLSYPDLTFASGEGAEILRMARFHPPHR